MIPFLSMGTDSCRATRTAQLPSSTHPVLCQNSGQPASTKELRISKSGQTLERERVTRRPPTFDCGSTHWWRRRVDRREAAINHGRSKLRNQHWIDFLRRTSPEPVYLRWKGMEKASDGDLYVRSGPGCVPRFVEKERRPPLPHQGIISGGNLRVFENLAQTLVVPSIYSSGRPKLD